MKIGWTRAARAGSLASNSAQAGADHLHVDRADVGAEGEAEIDEPIFAGEVAVADPPAVLVGERERRRPSSRPGAAAPRRRLRAGGEQQRQQQGRQQSAACDGRFRS